MNFQKDDNWYDGLSPRIAAIVGGIGLLIMAVLAAYANFGIMQNLIIPGEGQSTIDNIIASRGSFRLAIISFLIVAVLDIIVSWALYMILKAANKPLSLIAAWFRIIYALIFAFSLTNLFKALQILTDAGISTNNEITSQALNRIDVFQTGWDIGLILFGLHLLLLCVISIKYGTIPKWLGILLAIAGLGYLVDSIGILSSPQYNLSLGEYTFFGELILIIWLLWRGIKGFPPNQETLD